MFYQQLKIPLYQLDGSVDPFLAELYFELQQQYRNYIFGLPCSMSSELQRQFNKLFKPCKSDEVPQYLDFALFNVAQQKKLLWRLHNDKHNNKNNENCFLLACRKANSNLLQGFESFLFSAKNLSKDKMQQDSANLARKNLTREFAPQRLAQIFKQASMVCLQANFEVDWEVDSIAISHSILRSFSKLEYHYAILWHDGLEI